jgi:predicted metal-dependent peptidase
MPDAGVLREHRATRAIQRMVEFAPSTGGLALWIRHADSPAGIEAPAAITDGHTIFYSAAFESLPLPEQAGVVAHEVLHIALRHPQRFLDLRGLLGDVDLQLFNICADAIVNSTLQHLSWLALPGQPVFLDVLVANALGLHEQPEAALLKWDVETLYRAIDDRRQTEQTGKQQQASQSGAKRQVGGKGQDDQGENGEASKSGGRRDSAGGQQDGPRATQARALGVHTQIDLAPGDGAKDTPEIEAERSREWGDRLARGHANDGAFSMLRALAADIPRSRTPWEHILRTLLARGLAMKPAVSWSRPTRSYIANQGRAAHNKRMPWEPGFTSTQNVPRLVVIIDVSGSIEADLLERFGQEIVSISRRQGCGMALIIGDDRVRSVQHFKPGMADLSRIEIQGGGGTDFTPLLREADTFQPDIGVVLSDLDGPAYFQPRWPVIWAVPPAHAASVPPFGRKLVLNFAK